MELQFAFITDLIDQFLALSNMIRLYVAIAGAALLLFLFFSLFKWLSSKSKSQPEKPDLDTAKTESPSERLRKKADPSEGHDASDDHLDSLSDFETEEEAPPMAEAESEPKPVAAGIPGGAALEREQAVAAAAPAPKIQERSSTIAKLGQLIENIPRIMRVGVPLEVEARIAQSLNEDISDGMRGDVTSHEIMTTPAMTVMLRAPEGGFQIEPITLETQWVNNSEAENLGIIDQPNFGQWLWRVTPTMRGRRRLKFSVAAHSANNAIPGANIPLPQQDIEIKVKVNLGAAVQRLALWTSLAVAGGVAAKFGEEIWAKALAEASKFMT